MELAEELNFFPFIEDRQENDPKQHAFGTPENHSAIEPIIGRVSLELPVGNGVKLPIRAFLVDGDVPLTIGKDSLRNYQAVESHNGDWLEVEMNGRVLRIPTFIDSEDNHSRILLSAESTLINEIVSEGQGEEGKENQSLVSKIHARTHVHPETCKRLLMRSNKWNKSMQANIDVVLRNFFCVLEKR